MSDRTAARRDVLRVGAGVGVAAVGLGGVGTAAAEKPFDGWLSNTSNFDGLVDRTGRDSAEVTVGVEGNSGSNGFGPAAVRIDPGTTVVWTWSGNGYHNVAARDDSYGSETVGEAGHTFEHTFESEGVQKYRCVPHEMMGMKGVVVVGDVEVAVGEKAANGSTSGPDYGSWFDNTANFETTVDETGRDEVTVKVGVEGNNGRFAFGPPAISVDPGTTVTWEWTGAGGAHNVVAKSGRFESDLTGEAGHTFSHTFDSGGVHKYSCAPHRNMGMKGAVVVPGGNGGSGGDDGPDLARWLTIGGSVGLVGGLFGLIGVGAREHRLASDSE